ncbi:WD40 repeat-like protein [Ramicandelaber brevisporus]|nr:WD40 repeat-like protein [Ramicandelaber brevisporus]
MNIPSWEAAIVSQLSRRAAASAVLATSVQTQDTLFRQLAASQQRVRALEDTVTTLRKTAAQQQAEISATAEANTAASLIVLQQHAKQLEAKVASQQSELNDMYRTQSQNAQRLLDLTDKVRIKDEQAHINEAEIALLKEQVTSLQRKVTDLVNLVREKDVSIQIQQDELAAAHLELTQIEERNKKLIAENEELVNRWLRKMHEEATKMDAEVAAAASSNSTSNKSGEGEAGGSTSPSDGKKIDAARKDSAGGVRNGGFSIVPRKVVQRISAHSHEVYALHVSPDESVFATGGQDKRVKLFDSRTGQNLFTLTGCLQSIVDIQFDRTGEQILACSNDGAVRVWYARNGRMRQTLTGHLGRVASARFTSNGRHLVSGSHDKTIKLWDLAKGSCTRTVFCTSSCNDVAIVGLDGTTAVSAHIDSIVRVWDLAQGAPVAEIKGHTNQVTSLAVPQNTHRRLVLTNSRDGTLRLIDVDSHDVVRTFSSRGYEPACSWARATISPDLQYIAAGSRNGSVYVWDVGTGNVVSTLSEHKTGVCAVVWGSSGSKIYSAERQQDVIVWGG